MTEDELFDVVEKILEGYDTAVEALSVSDALDVVNEVVVNLEARRNGLRADLRNPLQNSEAVR